MSLGAKMLQSVDKITFDARDVIGTGSSSVVYRGTFGLRVVAVKKVDKTQTKILKAEIELLQEYDQHQNIIRYFTSEEDARHHYLALELCLCTLREYVSQPTLKIRLPVKPVIEQMLAGLEYLHTTTPPIIHRDIKPTNVLLLETATGQLVVKISDFGFAKQMHVSDSQMSVIPDESIYWKVPEMKKRRYNLKSDVYSMGCLIYYLVHDGVILLTNELVDFRWDDSSSPTSEGVCAKHLIRVMTHSDPDRRPSINCMRGHPFFWTEQKILTFLVKVADRIKDDYRVKRVLEEDADQVIGSSWLSILEPEIVQSLIYRSARHNYNGGLVCELLRALRNKEAHYDEIGGSAKKIFGSLPEKFTSYWQNKFPLLLPHVFLKVHRSGLHTEENFSQFYPSPLDCHALFDI